MKNISFAAAAFTVALLLGGPATPALAQDRGHDERGHDEHWREGDARRFHGHDFEHWRHGGWYHGFHDGRGGWWWIVDGEWFFYPAPIYPYPDPFAPPVVVAAPPPPPPPNVAPAPPAQGQYWYYCANPPGYYPYVPQCTVPWTPVRAQP